MLHYRDTYATVHLDYLLHNVETLYQKVKKPMMAILKANAYGHGYKEVAHILKDSHMIAMFGVATLKEAIDLRQTGVKKDILILGAIPLEDLDLVIENDITLTVYSKEYAKEIICLYHHNKPVKVHLKVDSGMNRLGLKTREEFEDVYQMCSPHIFNVTGVFTHFAVADDPSQNKEYFQQIKTFESIIKGYGFKYIHSQNSASMMYHDETATNMTRIGIAMYGVDPSGGENSSLKQVMSLYTKVAMVKKVNKGEHIGYGYTYQTNEDEYIATLPIGYADGLIRANQGRYVVINGKEYPIVGRVCMDQMMIRVDETVKPHDLVEIFGEHMTLSRMAKELHTIPYEIICLVSERVERVYVEKE